MPNQKQTMLELSSASLEKLPNELWEKIGNYLDRNTKYRLQLVSHSIKDRIVANCLAIIHFENPMQYQKFIAIKSAAQNQIRNLDLPADVTDCIFPFPKDYKALEFSFFSDIKKHFPAVKNITLEPKHFYMLPMLTDDPQFNHEDNTRLIKGLTLKPNLLLGKYAKPLITEKYGQNIDNIKTNLLLFNSDLKPQSLAVFEKFTALQYLSINFTSIFEINHCDYEDIDHLLLSLPQLKTLDIHVPYDLSCDPQKTRLNRKEKKHPVGITAFKNYPNITHLILNGWPYWPASLLSHFPALNKLALNFSFSYIWSYQNNVSIAEIDLPNRINQLLAEVSCPEKLLSLELFASVPVLTAVVTPNARYSAVKLIPIRFAELVRFTHLQQLTLHQPKDLHLRITEDRHSPFTQLKISDQSKNYILPAVRQLEIHYGPYNVYHPGDLKAIRSIFPHLKFLTLIKDAVDEDKLTAERAKEIKEKTWHGINQLSNELNDLMHENPWQDIQINLDKIDIPNKSQFFQLSASENSASASSKLRSTKFN